MDAGQSSQEKTSAYGRTALGLAALALSVLFLKNADHVNAAVGQGILLCVNTMIPSLFPFMVISELIVRTDMGRVVARAFSWLLRPLLGLSEGGVCAVVMGVLCGFPVGAKTAADHYRAGGMSVREFQHVLCFCHWPSVAFLLGVVGASVFGNSRVGWILLALGLVSSLIVGVLFRFLLPRRVQGEVLPVRSVTRPRAASLLPDAVSAAAGSMLGVCATVVLFSALVGVIDEYAAAWSLDGGARTALLGVLELSTGVRACARVASAECAFLLCAAMLGWGGLSVHCQVLAVCDGCPVSLGVFWLSRALNALLMVGGAWACLRVGAVDVARAALPPSAVYEDVAWTGAQTWSTGGLIGVLVILAAVAWRQIKRREERAR